MNIRECQERRKKMAKYVIAEHNKDSDWCEFYSMLKGPNNFECCLTEPEDRTWYRDGRSVVEELNKLQTEIERLSEILSVGCYSTHLELIKWLKENKVISDLPFVKNKTIVLRMMVIHQALIGGIK